MMWLRELFLGNWRNKSVALFFAITIWFVVFQSEKQEFTADGRITLVPVDPQAMIITRVERPDPVTGQWVEFHGEVQVTFEGPRKQIDDLRQSVHLPGVRARVEVKPEEQLRPLVPEDFSYDQQGVEITHMIPESVRVTQEEVETAVVTNLRDYVTVTDSRDGWEIALKEVDPSEVRIRGPKSILPSVQPKIHVSMGFTQDRYRDDVTVELTYPESVARLVEDGKVRVEPGQVRVEVALKASTATLAADAVRLTFRMAAPDIPITIKMDDLAGGTIPVEFFGPKDQISRLKQKLEDPAFSVGVLVPPLDLEPGKTEALTFTEVDLELYDFPSTVQRRPHPDRSPRPWTYRVQVADGEQVK